MRGPLENARAALDATGRFLIAVDHAGHTIWCTPQAGHLLGGSAQCDANAQPRLPIEVARWLKEHSQLVASVPPLTIRVGVRTLKVSYVGQVGADEILLRLSSDDTQDNMQVFQRRLGLTAREAEVLLWAGRGKSNREIAQILAISHRTINKHLDQVYAKLGVGNRTAAAAVIAKVIDGR